jgi:hypothetical protein
LRFGAVPMIEIDKTLRVATASPGMVLVTLGFMILFFSAKVTADVPILATYGAIAFAFIVTISGIVLLFRSGVATQPSDASLAVAGSSDVEETVRQLGKNYDILRRQAMQGFVLAGTFMALGILVILTGSLGDMFGFTKATSNLTTIAGIIIEAISGLGLYLFKETFRQLNATSDRLNDMWRILAAFKKTDDLPEEKKADVVITLINKLIEPAK